MVTQSLVLSPRVAAAAGRQVIRSPGADRLLTRRHDPDLCLRRPVATVASTRVVQGIHTPGRVPGLVHIPETADVVIVAILVVPALDAADM